MNLENYVNKKMADMVAQDIEPRYSSFCRLVEKVCERNLLEITVWNWGRSVTITDPQDSHKNLTAKGRENAAACGLYVHMLNKYIQEEKPAELFIPQFLAIEGEICVANLEDYQLTSQLTFGFILKAKPTATFSCDCWSKINKHGERYATREDNQSRNESWIIPADSEIVAIVGSKRQMSDNCGADIVIGEFADYLKVPVVDIGSLKKFTEPIGLMPIQSDTSMDYYDSVQDKLLKG